MRLLAVTGMHRSGTSLIAGMLRALGWDVGPDEDLMPAKPDNPRGFVEHLPLVRLNDRLLHRTGGSWDRPPALPPGWQHDRTLDDLRADAEAVVAALARRDAPRTLVKDPRLSLTLPFWQTVAEIPAAVLVLRPPAAVVRSLLRREDEMDAARAADLYVHYLLSVHRHDVDLHVLDPRDVLQDPTDALPRLAAALGHTPSPEEVAAAAGQVEATLWGRSSRGAGDDEPAGIAGLQRLFDVVRDADPDWQSLLGSMATVTELAAAGRSADAARSEAAVRRAELSERVDALRETLDRERQRADRLLAERERAREGHDRMRAQRDSARAEARGLQAQVGTTDDGP